MKTDLNDTLKQAGRAGAPTHHRPWLRGTLVVSQVAMSLVLLVGMTLCARSLQKARSVDLGLDPHNVWGAGFRLPPVGYDDDRTRGTYRRLRQQLAELPGVESVALADWLPRGSSPQTTRDSSQGRANDTPAALRNRRREREERVMDRGLYLLRNNSL